jgi:hypothetical protein
LKKRKSGFVFEKITVEMVKFIMTNYLFRNILKTFRRK